MEWSTLSRSPTGHFFGGPISRFPLRFSLNRQRFVTPLMSDKTRPRVRTHPPPPPEKNILTDVFSLHILFFVIFVTTILPGIPFNIVIRFGIM